MVTKTIRTGLPAFALVALAGCSNTPITPPTAPLAGPEPVSAAAPGRSAVAVPIRGTWDNQETPPVPTPPAGCLLLIGTRQTGEATHLGRFTGEGETCATSQAQTDSPPFWDQAPAPPYAVMDFTNRMVWTAANGDELWLEPNGGMFVFSLSNGAASVRGWLNVAGGTGRFDGATGHLEVTGGRAPGEPADHLAYEGTIEMVPGAVSR